MKCVVRCSHVVLLIVGWTLASVLGIGWCKSHPQMKPETQFIVPTECPSVWKTRAVVEGYPMPDDGKGYSYVQLRTVPGTWETGFKSASTSFDSYRRRVRIIVQEYSGPDGLAQCECCP